MTCLSLRYIEKENLTHDAGPRTLYVEDARFKSCITFKLFVLKMKTFL